MSHSHTHSHSSHSHSHYNSSGHHSGDHISHSHPHDNSPGDQDKDLYADANKRHFDGEAITYEDQAKTELAHTQSQKLLQMYPFDADQTAVMDYACGTGLMSRELAPHVKSIVGVDISQGMVDQYNNRANDQGMPPEMKAVCTELKGEEGELDGRKFDVIVCAMAYHHFSSIDAVTHTLAFFLKPGGSLMVLDMIKPETLSEETEHVVPEHVRHIVPHTHAFSEEDVRFVYQSAGLEEFTFKNTGSLKIGGKEVNLFIAKGTKRKVIGGRARDPLV